MSTLAAKLDQIESRLRTLIEGRFARLLPALEYRTELINTLESAMRSGIRIQRNGSVVAPDAYVLSVHPDLVPGLENNHQLLEELAEIIQEVGSSAGLVFFQPPRVTVSANMNSPNKSVEVFARINMDGLSQTVESSIQNEEGTGNLPKNAFLIVNGAMIFPLNQTLVNIGRRPNNDLVIDDPRVSRAHVQLRAIRGKYVLSDLDSKGGTFVNDKRVMQCTLYPKDVISLAGVPLVYGHDDDHLGSTQQVETRPPTPIEGDHSEDTIL